jgi:hypothetical protein
MMKDERRTPGANPDALKIDVSFEEAVRRLTTKPVPAEGVPRVKLRERRSPKEKKRD